jgi:cephalosporin hydroxylase
MSALDRLEPAVLAAFTRLVRRQQRAGGVSAATERALAVGLRGLRVTTPKKRARRSPAVRGVIDAFNRLYYADHGTWRSNTWLGVRTWKCPTDLWLYQEIIAAVRPGLIIETGTAFGGSAMFLGWICDAVGHGQIVSIDLQPKVPVDQLPTHPRVRYLIGSSTDPAIVEQALAMRPPGEPVLVILDSDHREAHVRDELTAYADAVTPGSYVIVEDTNVNDHPVYASHGPGPWEAVEWFLGRRSDFAVDTSMHRHHLSFNPRGYLKRS